MASPLKAYELKCAAETRGERVEVGSVVTDGLQAAADAIDRNCGRAPGRATAPDVPDRRAFPTLRLGATHVRLKFSKNSLQRAQILRRQICKFRWRQMEFIEQVRSCSSAMRGEHDQFDSAVSGVGPTFGQA